jgi:hypothetical protein
LVPRVQEPSKERLITGDTAPDRLREARESGLILLQPVTNIKLRATVRNLIRANIRDRIEDFEGSREGDHRSGAEVLKANGA